MRGLDQCLLHTAQMWAWHMATLAQHRDRNGCQLECTEVQSMVCAILVYSLKPTLWERTKGCE